MERGVATLGVDFGRVINDASGDPSGEDTAFLGGTEEEMLATPAMRGAFDSLERLCEVFSGRIWIISKCGPAVQSRTERWLVHHRFFESTGIEATHVRFCRRREDKALHCREIGVTHFVDDRFDVLEHLVGLVPYLFLFGAETAPPSVPVRATPTWEAAETSILATL